MEKEKFEPTPMPEVSQCESFENFQALADKWDAEGFRLDRNMPDNQNLFRYSGMKTSDTRKRYMKLNIFFSFF